MKGYIIIARKSLESEIWEKPPLYWKVWCYLLMKANWKDHRNLRRGQLITSLNDIAEGVAWYEGFRKIKPTKDQIFNILEWLRGPCGSNDGSNDGSNSRATMVTTAKTTQGMLISIVKYGVYQDFEYYGNNDGSNDGNATGATMEETMDTDTKNRIQKEYKENTVNNNTLLNKLISDAVEAFNNEVDDIDDENWW